MVRILLFLVLLTIVGEAISQQRSSNLEYLNKQILFLNESVHGFLIAHRVYENFNQSINAYVDLPSHEINKYGNKDLPLDIFADPERWFYERSPQSLYQDISADSRKNQFTDTWPLIVKIKNIADIVNQGRMTIEKAIQDERINEMANIQSIYDQLEECVTNYDRVGDAIEAFEKILLPHYLECYLPEIEKAVYTSIVELHYEIKNCLHYIEADQLDQTARSNVKILKDEEQLAFTIQKIEDPQERKDLNTILERISSFSKIVKAYLSKTEIPEAYEALGPAYYYHNVKLLTLLNRYGNGYASAANAFFEKSDWSVIHLIEESHYLKVIYPERITKEVLLDRNIDPELDIAELELPALPTLEEIVVAKDTVVTQKLATEIAPIIVSSQILIVDTAFFELELFDHRTKDGDLVSISINGEWVFNNISLEKKIRRLKLSINPDAVNTIMIRAENTGWMPPNTVGVKYRSKNGKVADQFIKQDLYENQVLEIKYKEG